MSTWVEPSKRDNHWLLFNNIYEVRVNELAARSIDDIKEFGMLVTGRKDFDKNIEKREIHRYMKIPEMAELHNNGVGIYLVKGSDSKEIYQIIEKHLSTWIDFLDHQIGVGDAPIEDLQKLDKLAHALYPIRLRNIAPGETVHSFDKALQNVLGKFRVVGLTAGKPIVKRDTGEEPKRSDGFGKLLNGYRDVQDYRRM
jgi:hypothetical protein